ncbi:hypothetical protein CHARACLAT_000432 [Characodon lateralis]|uniref:Uncharacterized protein n=1 Tax=Characodon lateralis TaxID=208331 RepID=A0ABU7DR34_9TELE|nr:hypothetical protein [Characodon lateralis]
MYEDHLRSSEMVVPKNLKWSTADTVLLRMVRGVYGGGVLRKPGQANVSILCRILCVLTLSAQSAGCLLSHWPCTFSSITSSFTFISIVRHRIYESKIMYISWTKKGRYECAHSMK